MSPPSPSDSSAIELSVPVRPRDLGGIPVGRILPWVRRRSVGPFIFFDRIGPVTLAPGVGLDVPPHPHVGLSTLTYLFSGAIEHRDSLGSFQAIAPGAVNWMTSGRGIAHSERSPAGERPIEARLDGVQLWVGLPRAFEEQPPSFEHHPAEALPRRVEGGVTASVLAGAAFGLSSPVTTRSPLFLVDARLSAGAELELPSEHAERAALAIEGDLVTGDARALGPDLCVFAPGRRALLRAVGEARVLLLGGEPLDGPRHLLWNFAASDPSRLELAASDWKAGRFASVPGDAGPPVPLPERRG